MEGSDLKEDSGQGLTAKGWRRKMCSQAPARAGVWGGDSTRGPPPLFAPAGELACIEGLGYTTYSSPGFGAGGLGSWRTDYQPWVSLLRGVRSIVFVGGHRPASWAWSLRANKEDNCFLAGLGGRVPRRA